MSEPSTRESTGKFRFGLPEIFQVIAIAFFIGVTGYSIFANPFSEKEILRREVDSILSGDPSLSRLPMNKLSSLNSIVDRIKLVDNQSLKDQLLGDDNYEEISVLIKRAIKQKLLKDMTPEDLGVYLESFPCYEVTAAKMRCLDFHGGIELGDEDIAVILGNLKSYTSADKPNKVRALAYRFIGFIYTGGFNSTSIDYELALGAFGEAWLLKDKPAVVAIVNLYSKLGDQANLYLWELRSESDPSRHFGLKGLSLKEISALQKKAKDPNVLRVPEQFGFGCTNNGRNNDV